MNLKKLVDTKSLLIGLFSAGFVIVGSGLSSNVLDVVMLRYLNQNRESILGVVNSNYAIIALVFILLYAISVGFFMPVAGALSLFAGAIFGLWGILFVAIGGTCAAVLNFMFARRFFGSKFQTKYEKELINFNSEFHKRGLSYLIGLRLIPVIPFALTNVLAGLTKVDLKLYIFSTIVGVVPMTILYILAGQELSQVRLLSDFLKPEILAIFVVVIILALYPLFQRKDKSKVNSKGKEN